MDKTKELYILYYNDHDSKFGYSLYSAFGAIMESTEIRQWDSRPDAFKWLYEHGYRLICTSKKDYFFEL